jgi:hypothetical protein
MNYGLMSSTNTVSTRVLAGLVALWLVFMAASALAFGTGSGNAMAAGPGAIAHIATVEETMNSAGYTYVQVKEDNRRYWIAAPETELQKGETISFYEQMMMEQFTSKTLQRTFDRILFVSAIAKGEDLPKAAAPVPNTRSSVLQNGQVRELGEAESQLSVAGVYANAPELVGKTIEVKGKVVKISHGIMDRNWIHLQDGSGEGGTSKIVFRTIQEGVAVGDEVVAKGIVEVNKNFGYNYFYPVIVEDAVFTSQR